MRRDTRAKKKKAFHISSYLSTFALLSPEKKSTKSFFPPLPGSIHLFGCEIRAIHHSWARGPCDRSWGEADLVIEILSAFYAKRLLPVFTTNSVRPAMETIGLYYRLSEASPPGPLRAEAASARAFIHRPSL